MGEVLFTKYTKLRADAVIPSRENTNDVGFDLTIIASEKVSEDIFRFDTGIAVEPPNDYYYEVVPRSSFSSTGYVMTNGIGIIDPDYRGSIKVTLTKVVKSAPELKLPYRGFQLILRPLHNNILLVESVLADTSRGSGGFGSTGDVRNDITVIRSTTSTSNTTTNSFTPNGSKVNYLSDVNGNIYN